MLMFKKFLFSNKNILGLFFASLIVVLTLLGIIKVMWVPLAMAFYVFGYLLGPKEKGMVFYHVKGEGFEDYVGFLNKIEAISNKSERFPQEAKEIISEIVHTAVELMRFLKEKNNIDILDDDMMSLRAIFDSYLPNLLTKYERLPKTYAENGRGGGAVTPASMLIEQLKMLNIKVKEISYGLYEDDVTALRVNERFIKERFKSAELSMSKVKVM